MFFNYCDGFLLVGVLPGGYATPLTWVVDIGVLRDGLLVLYFMFSLWMRFVSGVGGGLLVFFLSKEPMVIFLL